MHWGRGCIPPQNVFSRLQQQSKFLVNLLYFAKFCSWALSVKLQCYNVCAMYCANFSNPHHVLQGSTQLVDATRARSGPEYCLFVTQHIAQYIAYNTYYITKHASKTPGIFLSHQIICSKRFFISMFLFRMATKLNLLDI